MPLRNRAQRSTPRFLHAFADQSESGAPNPDQIAGRYARIRDRSETYFLLRLVHARLMDDDPCRRHPRKRLVLVHNLLDESRRLLLIQIRLFLALLIPGDGCTLESKWLDLVREGLSHACIHDIAFPALQVMKRNSYEAGVLGKAGRPPRLSPGLVEDGCRNVPGPGRIAVAFPAWPEERVTPHDLDGNRVRLAYHPCL